jgi:hypothetical protein
MFAQLSLTNWVLTEVHDGRAAVRPLAGTRSSPISFWVLTD